MPSRNIMKEQIPDSYYHIYARGINKQKIFIDNIDYGYFVKLFERYLSKKPSISKTGEIYPHYLNKVHILVYCLMSNHFHLLLHQVDLPYMEKFMRSLMTSYSRYFNLKYKRTGPVFESCYKAVLIADDVYLQHVSRYIHLNPRTWVKYRYSSLKYYRDVEAPFWLNTETILNRFQSKIKYIEYISDYKDMRDELDIVKYKLDNK